jgi:hypothetical protein
MVKRKIVLYTASSPQEQSKRKSFKDNLINNLFRLVLSTVYVPLTNIHRQAEDVERHFSLNDLRTLFKYNDNTTCETHETFKCKRCRDGKQIVKAPAFLYGDTSTYVLSGLLNSGGIILRMLEWVRLRIYY